MLKFDEPCFASVLTGADLILLVFHRNYPALNQVMWLSNIWQAAELYLVCDITYSNYRPGQLPPQSLYSGDFILHKVNVNTQNYLMGLMGQPEEA